MSRFIVKASKRLGQLEIKIDLEIAPKGITAIFGRSGAGKTSLINMLAGVLTPDSGYIAIDGQVLFDSGAQHNLPTYQRQVGYVFQDSRLFPHYTVKGNLCYGMKLRSVEAVSEVCQLLDIGHLLTRYPNQLSGGEQQRVAIGRALLAKPRLLLMDEPLASLDLPRKREVMPYLEQLAEQINIPILYVTHSLAEIARLAQNIIMLDEGKVLECGELTQVWQSHAMRPWQSFTEQSSLFEAKIVQHSQQYGLSKVALADGVELWTQYCAVALGSTVRVQIRAGDVSIMLTRPTGTSIRNVLPTKIVAIEQRQQAPDRQSVVVELAIGPNRTLSASITQWALDELKLAPEMVVFAQIKGVSISQRDISLTYSPH